MSDGRPTDPLARLGEEIDKARAERVRRQPVATDPDEFRRRFNVMALQRNLKALGTFGYQTMSRRNTVYIQYMPRTLRYVRTNLVSYERFARLRELLAAHVVELQ